MVTSSNTNTEEEAMTASRFSVAVGKAPDKRLQLSQAKSQPSTSRRAKERPPVSSSGRPKERVKTWLNLSVKVNQNGSMAKGLAIKSSQLDNWPHIGRKELVDEACKHGQSAVNISVPFAPTAPGETKSKKAIKLPISLFRQTMLDIALNARQKIPKMPNGESAAGGKLQTAQAQAADSDENELGISSPLNEDQLQSIKTKQCM
ncbi:hypothetical protein ACROYT_G014662 [Oculina patagonica]